MCEEFAAGSLDCALRLSSLLRPSLCLSPYILFRVVSRCISSAKMMGRGPKLQGQMVGSIKSKILWLLYILYFL
uniref:Uncharacterized protein n=1 Tax=Triticum urartu TaxID=4572 RepID=A0A8R7QFK8_TRIUA